MESQKIPLNKKRIKGVPQGIETDRGTWGLDNKELLYGGNGKILKWKFESINMFTNKKESLMIIVNKKVIAVKSLIDCFELVLSELRKEAHL